MRYIERQRLLLLLVMKGSSESLSFFHSGRRAGRGSLGRWPHHISAFAVTKQCLQTGPIAQYSQRGGPDGQDEA